MNTPNTFRKLFEPFPPEMTKTRKQGGQKLTYVDWVSYVVRAHNEMTPAGFCTEIRGIQSAGGYLYVIVRVLDQNTGNHHDGLGLAPETKDKIKGYGGAGPEAFSQALRRAFAMHGMGLDMYMDEDEFNFNLQYGGGDAENQVDETDNPGSGVRPNDGGSGNGRVRGPDASRETDAAESTTARTGSGSEQRSVRRETEATEGAETDPNQPTEAQRARVRQLWAIFVAAKLDTTIYARKLKHDGTKKGFGVVVRLMKEELKENEIEVPEEGEGKS